MPGFGFVAFVLACAGEPPREGIAVLLPAPDSAPAAPLAPCLPELAERPVGPERSATMAVTPVDLDGDGRLEVVVANGKHDAAPNTIYRSVHGVLDVVEPFGFSERSFRIAAGDLDGDGRIDLAIANEAPTGNRVCFSWPAGIECRALPMAITRDVDLVDLDGDDDLDIVLTNKRQPELLLFNERGTFEASRTLDDGVRQSVVAATGDLDRDGRVDLVVGSRGDGPTAIHRGVPGGFDEVGIEIDAERVRAVAIVDLDGDDALDVVLGSVGRPNTVIANDGTLGEPGSTPPVPEPFCPHPHDTWTVAVADLNGDGRLDIVEGNVASVDEIHLAQLDGSFGPGLPFGAADTDTRDVAVADIDGDGAPEIVVGRFLSTNVLVTLDGC